MSVYIAKTQAEFVEDWINQWAASLEIVPVFNRGSIALAVAEATANIATTLQFMAANIIDFARASTSTGANLDSWMLDYGFTRLPSQYANGQVTFSAPAPLTQPAFIPVGTIVQTPGGAITYTVIPNNSLPTYNSSTRQYQIPAGQSATVVAVQATIPGAAFNVQHDNLTQIQTTIFGVSSVNNALAIVNGSNTESDAAFRARFIDYINGLSKATEDAIYNAINSLQTGLKIALYENVIPVGNPPTDFITYQENPLAFGNILALVSDASGLTPAELITQANLSMGATRAFGIRYQAMAPSTVPPVMQSNFIATEIVVKAGYTPATVASNVTLKVREYINGLAIGAKPAGVLYLGKLIAFIINSDPGVDTTVLNSTTIDGLAEDFVVEPWQMLFVSLTQISVTVAS